MSSNSNKSKQWKFTDSGSTIFGSSTTIKTDSNISTGSTTPSFQLDVDGSLTVDEEKLEELKELRQDQFKKLDKLRDHIIDYLAANEISSSGVRRWKRDLEEIEEYRDQLNVSSDHRYIVFPNTLNEDDILGPEDLEKLNEIYDRWS